MKSVKPKRKTVMMNNNVRKEAMIKIKDGVTQVCSMIAKNKQTNNVPEKEKC